MLTRERQFFLLHVEWGGHLYLVLSLLDIGDRAFLFQFRERILYRLDVIFLQLLLDDRVIIPIDERIVLRLVLDNSHLGIHIVLHLVMIPVEMVGRDIH